MEYEVTLPAPNTDVSDTAVVTLSFVNPPDAAVAILECNDDDTANLIIQSPLGASLEYSIDGINFQSGTTFNNLSEGNYTIIVRDSTTRCIQTSLSPISFLVLGVETVSYTHLTLPTILLV